MSEDVIECGVCKLTVPFIGCVRRTSQDAWMCNRCAREVDPTLTTPLGSIQMFPWPPAK